MDAAGLGQPSGGNNDRTGKQILHYVQDDICQDDIG